MIKLENTVTASAPQIETIVKGMRNPMNSWDKSDSAYYDRELYLVGEADHDLMMRLAKGGAVHAKYRRMIPVYVDITAPLYFLKELDTYRVGTVCNSCSTMHKIQAKEFVLDDFSHEHLGEKSIEVLQDVILNLNTCRELYLATKNKEYWWQMIQLLPSSYNQKRTYMFNYEVLHNIYFSRKDHRLDEWHDFCDWIEWLPTSDIITVKES